jgi:fatty-acyl-CoA synthase
MATHRPPYRDVTIGALLTQLAEALPDHEALVDAERSVRWSFAELEAEVRRIGRGLMACGVERGERVALWATNVPEWIVLHFALAKIGAILVTVNTALRGQEVDYLLRQCEAATLFTIRGFKDVDYLGVLREIGALGQADTSPEGTERQANSLPHLRRVIFIGEGCPEGLMRYAELRTRAEEVTEVQLAARERGVGVDDVINMQYTSGTTGFPKGVMLSSRNILNNGYWVARELGYTPQDRLCLCVPLFHCFGCVLGVLGAYTHGVCLCPVEFFDARKVLETVERERCTALYGVPTMFLAELEAPDFARFDLTSLRKGVMAGALCPEPLMRRVIADMHLTEMTIAYGLTEASPVITQTPLDATLEQRTQTVGQVLPEIEVKIVDPATGASVRVDEPGELCTRGYLVMKGYYNNPDATRAAVDAEGWLRSGDQATIDRDGFVRITGRLKDIIIRGGENIAPKEVEDLLRRHPAVADVSVYGIHSERFGEEVAAAVRLNAGTEATAEDLQAFCQGQIARFKIPRHIRFVTAFPQTASGKIQKFRLREEHEAALGKG